jgi:hypothetical protein
VQELMTACVNEFQDILLDAGNKIKALKLRKLGKDTKLKYN